MNNKVTNIEVMDTIRAFAYQSKSNIAFGVLADIEHGEVSIFIKGEESDILALLAMQMAKDSDFKKLLFRAVDIYKIVPIEIIQKAIKEDEYSQKG